MDRRNFLKKSTLLATAPFVPEFLAQTALAAEKASSHDTILVVIEMTGGNDGLSMAVPYTDDEYYKARPKLAIPKAQVLKVTDEIGLHPSFLGMQNLVTAKQVAIIQGVGYPNSDRSHFESMDRWQCAEVTKEVSGRGWLAKSTDGLSKGEAVGVPVMHVGGDKLPMACRGAVNGVLSIHKAEDFELRASEDGGAGEKPVKKLLADVSRGSLDEDELLSFVRRRQLQTFESIDTLKEVLDGFKRDPYWGQQFSSLTGKMNLISRLIREGFGTRVFYVAIDGFDTHANQLADLQRLYAEVGTAISSLFNDLARSKDDKRVAVLTFSEFGRRVAENGSGTDHGAGSFLLCAGPGIKGGTHGKRPSLTDLDQGDLKVTTDFRQVYATLLEKWLKVESKGVLGDKFDTMNFVA